MNEDFEIYDEGESVDDEDEDECFECGEDIDGGCSLAGSEECDFECPNRNSMIARRDRKYREDAHITKPEGKDAAE